MIKNEKSVKRFRTLVLAGVALIAIGFGVPTPAQAATDASRPAHARENPTALTPEIVRQVTVSIQTGPITRLRLVGGSDFPTARNFVGPFEPDQFSDTQNTDIFMASMFYTIERRVADRYVTVGYLSVGISWGNSGPYYLVKVEDENGNIIPLSSIPVVLDGYVSPTDPSHLYVALTVGANR